MDSLSMPSNDLPDLTAHLGPAPFRFTPTRDTVTSSAFSLPFKVLAMALVLGLAFWAYQLYGLNMAQREHLWIWAAWGIMAYTVAHVLLGKTRLTAQTLEQTWIWHKKVELRDLAYVKLIRVPGLDALIAPRLYARTLMGKFTVIYACDPEMIEEFKRLVAELQAFRQMR
jgi:hypothetical protein